MSNVNNLESFPQIIEFRKLIKFLSYDVLTEDPSGNVDSNGSLNFLPIHASALVNILLLASRKCKFSSIEGRERNPWITFIERKNLRCEGR